VLGDPGESPDPRLKDATALERVRAVFGENLRVAANYINDGRCCWRESGQQHGGGEEDFIPTTNFL